VVSSNVCAIPEICGGGGIFCDPDDAQGVADALARLLNDADAWASFSRRAGENAARFSWATCTPPLASVFEELAGHG
jgi:alpha-1,3-rhamnosyl/mannosyltransferase